MTNTILEDLYAANTWAMQRLLQLCQGLSNEQLDEARKMGFGTLRSTLFHILTAEQIWLERWQGVPWRPFPMDPEGASLEEIAAGFNRVDIERQAFLNQERSTGWKRAITYRDSQQMEYRKPLDELLLHVANHGIHHRAQALNYLKHLGRTVPVGIEYLFYRLARPSIEQEESTIAALQGYGLEINSAPGVEIAWEPERVARYFAYHDWANGKILNAAAQLDDAALDREFNLGMGSLRKTLVHLYDVEPGWLKVWQEGSGSFASSEPNQSLSELQLRWLQVAKQRNEFVAELNESTSHQIVSINFGGPPIRFRILESILQICVHGTHHRAQVVNMLRHSGQDMLELDYYVWVPNVDSEE